MFLKKDALGLDIGSENVKFAYLEKDKKGIHLKAFGAKKIEKKEEVAKCIKELFDEQRIKTKKVFASIPSGENAVVKYLTLPWMPHEELYDSLKYDAQDALPFDIEEIYFDFQVLDEYQKGKGRMMDILFAAAKKETVKQYLNILKEAGLYPECLNIDIFAMEEVYIFNEEEKKGTVALLNIGERITNLEIVEKGISRFCRDIFIGARKYTESIAQQLNITLEEAKKIKESLNLESPHLETLSFTLEQTNQLLLHEINRSFTYYSTQLRRESVTQMYIGGGGSKLFGLKDALSKNLGIQVKNLNPFLKLHNATEHSADYLEENAPLYIVCVGLALRGLL